MVDGKMDWPTFNYGLAGGGSEFWGSHTQVDFASCASWWNRKASFDVEEERRGEDRAYDQGKEVGGTHPAGQREQRISHAGHTDTTGSASYKGHFLMEWSKFNVTIFQEQQMKKFSYHWILPNKALCNTQCIIWSMAPTLPSPPLSRARLCKLSVWGRKGDIRQMMLKRSNWDVCQIINSWTEGQIGEMINRPSIGYHVVLNSI